MPGEENHYYQGHRHKEKNAIYYSISMRLQALEPATTIINAGKIPTALSGTVRPPKTSQKRLPVEKQQLEIDHVTQQPKESSQRTSREP